MKTVFTRLILFLMVFTGLDAQSVDITESPNNCFFNGESFNLNGTVDGRNRYSATGGGFHVQWSNSMNRWELRNTAGTVTFYSTTTDSSPNPPTSAFATSQGTPWTTGICGVLTLTGSGTQDFLSASAPEILIENNANDEDIADGSTTINTTLGTDYGSICHAGTASSSSTYKVSNTGNADLTFGGTALTISNTTDFSITTGINNNSTLAASNNITFTIQFDPQSAGTKTCTVTVNSDDADEGVYTFAIQGVGLNPTVTVAATTATVTEDGVTNLVYRFTRDCTSGALATNFSVAGTAQDSDYSVSSAATFSYNQGTNTGSITFPDGDATVDLIVNPTDDALIEASETVVVTVETGTDYTVGGTDEATGNITNDDEACSGESVTVAAGIKIEGSDTYSWSDPTIGNTQEFPRTFTSNTTFMVTITNGGDMVNQTINVVVNAVPAPTISATENSGTANDGIIASGENVTLDCGIVGAAAYAWSHGGGTNQTATYNNVTTTTTYSVTVENSDGCSGTANFTVTVTEPEIEVSVSGTQITDGDVAANVANVTDFGDVCVNTSTVAVTYTIANTGTEAMTITAPTIIGSSDFSVTTPVTGTTIPAGGSTTFTVTFDPSSAGAKTATINIPNNDADENPFNFSIDGNGIAPPAVNLSVSANSGTEAATTMITVTATADAAVLGAQTVDVAVSGTNVTGGDYSLPNTITIPDGMTTGSVTFTVVDDDVFEATETATLTISNPSDCVTIGGTATQNVTITDNETVTINLQNTTSSVAETAGNASITAVLSGVPAGGMEVAANFTVTPAAGTATAGNDYTAGGVNNNFAAGSSNSATASVNIPVIDDNIFEGDENFTVALSSADAAVTIGATNAATVTITDDETVDISFTSATYNGDEGDGTIDVIAQITGIPAGGLGVMVPAIVNTADGSAVAADYTALTNETMNFPTTATNGQTATFAVTITDDGDVEPDEDFTATLTSSLSGVNVIAPSAATVTIADNDAVPEIEVSAGGVQITDGSTTPSTPTTDFEDVCVNTATFAITYTITNTGTLAMTITAPVLSGSSDFSVTTPVTGTTIPIGGSTTFEITFDPSSAGMKTATVNIANNDSDENPFDFVIGGTGIHPTVSVSVVTPASTTVPETGAMPITYRFTRADCTAGPLTVNFALTGTSSNVDGTDFNATFSNAGTYNNGTGTITFADGVATTDLIITPVGDSVVEQNETVIVTITP